LADLPSAANDAMWKRRWLFYTFIGKGACRLMCARDTVKADMDAIVTDLKSVL
jgi:threonine aldolase